MSAKKAKAVRKQINAERFPALSNNLIGPVSMGNPRRRSGRFNNMTYQRIEVGIDHNRRIRRLAQSLRINVALAIEKYRSHFGFPRPVKYSDAEMRVWAEKGYQPQR